MGATDAIKFLGLQGVAVSRENLEAARPIINAASDLAIEAACLAIGLPQHAHRKTLVSQLFGLGGSTPFKADPAKALNEAQVRAVLSGRGPILPADEQVAEMGDGAEGQHAVDAGEAQGQDVASGHADSRDDPERPEVPAAVDLPT